MDFIKPQWYILSYPNGDINIDYVSATIITSNSFYYFANDYDLYKSYKITIDYVGTCYLCSRSTYLSGHTSMPHFHFSPTHKSS